MNSLNAWFQNKSLFPSVENGDTLDIWVAKKGHCKQWEQEQQKPALWHYWWADKKKCAFDNCAFDDGDNVTTKDCLFWDLTLRCPVGAKKYLRNCFGKTGYNLAYVFNHKNPRDHLKINLREDNRNDHVGLLPALDRTLADKLFGTNPNFASFAD